MKAVACLRLEKWRWTVSGAIVMPFSAVPYAVPEARNLNNPTLAVWGGQCAERAACRRHATTNIKRATLVMESL